MFPASSAIKNNLPVMLVNTSTNDQIKFTDVKILLSIYQFFCSNVNTINKSMILHNINVNFFASKLIALYLFITHPCFFLFSIKLCESPSNLLTMFSKQMKVIPSKYQYQCTLIFSVIQVGIIRLEYNSFDTDMGIQMM